MRLSKTALMGGVAALAISVGTVGFGVEAEAFDNVSWTWDKFIDDDTDKNVNIDITLTPLGDITDQALQIQIGSVRASAEVNDIANIKPREEITYTE